MSKQILSKSPVAQPRLVLRLYNRWFGNWARRNGRSIRALCYHLPLYLWGSWSQFRKHSKRTKLRMLFGVRQWASVERWSAPALYASVMDGMGEHYGYPRHHCYLLIWWNRRGYAFGVEFSCPQNILLSNS